MADRSICHGVQVSEAHKKWADAASKPYEDATDKMKHKDRVAAQRRMKGCLEPSEGAGAGIGRLRAEIHTALTGVREGLQARLRLPHADPGTQESISRVAQGAIMEVLVGGGFLVNKGGHMSFPTTKIPELTAALPEADFGGHVKGAACLPKSSIVRHHSVYERLRVGRRWWRASWRGRAGGGGGCSDGDARRHPSRLRSVHEGVVGRVNDASRFFSWSASSPVKTLHNAGI